MNKKSLKVLSLAMFAFMALPLAACGDNNTTDSVSNTETQSSTSLPSIAEGNTFESGIDAATQQLLAAVASGSFTSASLPSGVASEIIAKYEVSSAGSVHTVVYVTTKNTGFVTIKYYIAVNTTSYKITGYKNDGAITNHGKDADFDNDALHLIGTDGSTIDAVASATVASNAIKDLAVIAVAQAQKDYTTTGGNDNPAKENYTIRFDVNGGEGSFPVTSVKADENIVRPLADPTKENYIFVGWYYNGERFDFTTKISDDIVLVAQWISAYTFHDGTIYKTPSVSSDGKLVIPSTIDGETVTTLNESLFLNNTSLKEVVIPSTVTKIGYSCFEGCTNLSKITFLTNVGVDLTGDSEALEADLEFGINAFSGCTSLKSIVIPSRVKTISTGMFENCTSLTSATVEGVSSLPVKMFAGCTSLKNVTLGSGLTKISSETFQNCTSLVTINIPDTVTDIQQNAFEGCTSLSSFTIPASVTTLGVLVFEGCVNLSTINVDAANTKYVSINNALYNKNSVGNPTKLLYVAKSNATSYEFPATVTSYDGTAFDAALNIKEYKVAEGNTTYVTIDGVLYKQNPSKVTYYLDSVPYAYEGTFEIPATVTSISTSAFKGCETLTNITLASGNTSFTLNDGLLINRYGTFLYYVNKSVSGVVELPNTITTITTHAFAYSNADGVSITRTTSVATLGVNAFVGVKSTFKIYVPEGYYVAYTIANSKADWTEEYRALISETPYVKPETSKE